MARWMAVQGVAHERALFPLLFPLFLLSVLVSFQPALFPLLSPLLFLHKFLTCPPPAPSLSPHLSLYASQCLCPLYIHYAPSSPPLLANNAPFTTPFPPSLLPHLSQRSSPVRVPALLLSQRLLQLRAALLCNPCHVSKGRLKGGEKLSSALTSHVQVLMVKQKEGEGGKDSRRKWGRGVRTDEIVSL